MKLLLCDDDISTIDVIQSQLNCSDMGISKMLRAYNGEVAKTIIMQEKPELILCDIGMPKCDGIEVLKFVHDSGIQTEFAFLTCFESFEYAQTALRYGATNYLTKPIDMDELNMVIRKMIANSKNRRLNASKEKDPIVINDLTNNMLREIRDGHYGVNHERLNRALNLKQFDFTADSIWRLIYIAADTALPLSNGWKKEMLIEGFQRLAEEIFTDNIGTAYTIADVGVKFTYLTCFVPAEKHTESELLLLSRKFIDLCVTTFSLNPVCIISDEVRLYKTYEIAPELSKRIARLRYQAGRIYLFRETENDTIDNYYYLDQEQILRSIRQASKTDFVELIANALNKIVHIRDSNLNMILRLYQELMHIFYGCLRDNGISTQVLLNNEIIGELDTLPEWSLSDFMKFAQSLFDFVVSVLHSRDDSADVIIKAKKYIAEHFREDIDRDDVASVIHITPNYLSKKFREETGMTLRQYINQLRIEEAKRLLLSTNMSIIEISSEIGYDNSSYFSTVFRKMCGVSPARWRETAEKGDYA